MDRLDRRTAALFSLQVAMLLAACLMPVPWVADAYGSAYAKAMNPFLAAASHFSPVGLRFEPPTIIRMRGAWTVPLVMEAHDTGEVVSIPFDVRALSYRPLTTFLIFALSWPLADRRRKARVVIGGLLLMGLVTTLFAALPMATTLAVAGVFGGAATRAALETATLALDTPAMTYVIPVLIWWALILATRSPSRARPGETSSAADAPPAAAP
jgi:hypothetical protein